MCKLYIIFKISSMNSHCFNYSIDTFWGALLIKCTLSRRSRKPGICVGSWNEEFQSVLEEAPLKEKIRIEVISKRTGFSFRRKVGSFWFLITFFVISNSLQFLNSILCLGIIRIGYVDINLNDVVHNGRINEKYNLINSRNGVLCVEIRWKVIWDVKPTLYTSLFQSLTFFQ